MIPFSKRSVFYVGIQIIDCGDRRRRHGDGLDQPRQGSGDLTWFYDSSSNSWDVVVRVGGTGVASPLGDPFTPSDGVGSGNDFQFNTLTIAVSNPDFGNVAGTDYYVALVGLSDESNNKPDVGLRTRLRELDAQDNEVAQFDSFKITLDWAASNKPDGAEFIAYSVDTFGNVDATAWDTANNVFEHTMGNWGHDHWNYGFSKLGDYDLVLNFEGVGGLHGGDAPTGSTTLSFTVIPEPASLALLGLGGLLMMRRRRA